MPERATRVRWLIVAALFAVYVLMFIDRVNISVAAKYIMAEYKLTSVQMGGVFSMFVLGYALFQIPGGWLGDRFGPRRVLAAAILWWSAFTAVTAFAADTFLSSILGVVGALALARLMIGVGEAAAPPNGARMIANWVPPSERGLAFGLTFSGNMLGAAIAPPLIVWVMVTWGWREGFYVAGAAGILVTALWLWLSADRPGQHRWANQAERDRIALAADATETAAMAGKPAPLRDVLLSRELWCLTGAYTAGGYVMYVYFSWFYLYLVDGRGVSIEAAGFYTMAPFAAAAIGAPSGGKLTDALCRRMGKHPGRATVAVGGMVGSALCIVAGASIDSIPLSVLFLSLGAGGLYGALATYWAAAVDISITRAGFATGIMSMGGNLGGALSPTLTPLLAREFGWAGALYAAAAIAALGALFWIGIVPRTRGGHGPRS